ncbi:MAG: hypothetical protein Q9181_001137 [Wetmoreana brouardii]
MQLLGPKALLLAAATLEAAIAHTTFTNFYLDGAPQGDGTCVRMSNNIPQATYPIRPVTSQDMACGVNGEKAVARVCPADSGAQLTFNFRDWPDGTQPGSLDKSHMGPCSVYMKKVDNSAADNNAAGPGWFKIFEEDYDNSTAQWCTSKIMANDGKLSVNLPTDLAAGYYLVRPELLALHQADKSPPDPQFYVGCAQIFLQSTGSSTPRDTVSIPGYVNMQHPAMTFDIWNAPKQLSFPQFGPSTYKSGSSKRQIETRAPQLNQIYGLKPANCIIENDNWCGVTLPSYSDEKGCYAASQKCSDQTTTCYGSARAVGSKNCKNWEDYCTSVRQACGSGNFNGPPSASSFIPAAPARLGGSGSIAGAPNNGGQQSAGYTEPKAAKSPEAPSSSGDNSVKGGSVDTCGSNVRIIAEQGASLALANAPEALSTSGLTFWGGPMFTPRSGSYEVPKAPGYLSRQVRPFFVSSNHIGLLDVSAVLSLCEQCTFHELRNSMKVAFGGQAWLGMSDTMESNEHPRAVFQYVGFMYRYIIIQIRRKAYGGGPVPLATRSIDKCDPQSPDGTTILASAADNRLSPYIIPPDLLSSSAPQCLRPHFCHPNPGPVYATAVYPSYDLQNPASTLYIASPRALPIRLRSSFSPSILASYPLVSPTTEEYIAPHSLLFSPDQPNIFFAGSLNLISTFDINRNGEEPVERMRTVPSKRSNVIGGVGGIKGIVSALSMSCGGILAAGTFGRWVGLYDGHGRGNSFSVFEVDDGTSKMEGGGTGVTQVLWSEDGRYLCAVERCSDGVGVWDIRGTGKKLAWLRGRNARTNQRMGVDVIGGELWAGGVDGMVRVWADLSMKDGTVDPTWGFKAHDDAVSSASWHYSGSVLATSSGQRHFNDPQPSIEDSDSEGSCISPPPLHSSIPGRRTNNIDNSIKIWAF